MLDSAERVQMPVSPHEISYLSIKWKEYLPCKTIVGIILACTWCSTNKPIGFIPGIIISASPPTQKIGLQESGMRDIGFYWKNQKGY